jgi:hypothetical protein
MRFRYANRISVFLRSRRDCWESHASAPSVECHRFLATRDNSARKKPLGAGTVCLTQFASSNLHLLCERLIKEERMAQKSTNNRKYILGWTIATAALIGLLSWKVLS